MSGDHEDHVKAGSASQAPEDVVLGFFSRCWRGECTLSITCLTGLGLILAVSFSLSWLEDHARAEQWSAEIQSAIAALGFSTALLSWTWFGLTMLRSSFRNYLRGQVFWPIVAVIFTGLMVIRYNWQIASALIDRAIGLR